MPSIIIIPVHCIKHTNRLLYRLIYIGNTTPKREIFWVIMPMLGFRHNFVKCDISLLLDNVITARKRLMQARVTLQHQT